MQINMSGGAQDGGCLEDCLTWQRDPSSALGRNTNCVLGSDHLGGCDRLGSLQSLTVVSSTGQRGSTDHGTSFKPTGNAS